MKEEWEGCQIKGLYALSEMDGDFSVASTHFKGVTGGNKGITVPQIYEKKILYFKESM